GIADEYGSFPSRPRDGLVQRCRIGLAYADSVAADDALEAPYPAQALDKPKCQPFELVGADGEGDAAVRHGVQRFFQAFIDPGPDTDVLAVVIDEVRKTLFDQLLRGFAGGCQALAQQRLGAVADQMTDRFDRHWWAPEANKGVIQRRGQVGRGVSQSPIEAEYHDIQVDPVHWVAMGKAYGND